MAAGGWVKLDVDVINPSSSNDFIGLSVRTIVSQIVVNFMNGIVILVDISLIG